MPHCKTTVQPTDSDKKSQPHKMALLVLQSVGSCVGQNQKSHFFANAPKE